jgi:hypothetical protein
MDSFFSYHLVRSTLDNMNNRRAMPALLHCRYRIAPFGRNQMESNYRMTALLSGARLSAAIKIKLFG